MSHDPPPDTTPLSHQQGDALTLDMPLTTWREILTRLAVNALATAIDQEHHFLHIRPDKPQRSAPALASRLAERKAQLETALADAHQAAYQLEKYGEKTAGIPDPQGRMAYLRPRLQNVRNALEEHRMPGRKRPLHRAYLVRIPEVTAFTAQGKRYLPATKVPMRMTGPEWLAIEEWRHKPTPRARREHSIYRLEQGRLKPIPGYETVNGPLGLADVLRLCVEREWPDLDGA